MNLPKSLAVAMTSGLPLIASPSSRPRHTPSGCTTTARTSTSGYPNGVGTRNAVDKGGYSTNFLRNNRIYWRAENHHDDL